MSKDFNQNVDSLFTGLDQVINTKTVVGEPQVIGDTIILPLVDVTFGMGVGAFNKETSGKGAGGIGGKISPCAVLVVRNGETKLVNVRNQDAVSKAMDLIPEAVNKVTEFIKNRGKEPDEAVVEAVNQEKEAESYREEI